MMKGDWVMVCRDCKEEINLTEAGIQSYRAGFPLESILRKRGSLSFIAHHF